jgi:hypothetical protein
MFDGRLISEIPDTLSHEFKKNRKWLRFGFHAKRDLALIDETGYKAGFNLVRGTLRRLGAGETDTIRCHYWNASMQQKEFLRLNGIKALLTQDDNKLPYGDDDSYTDCGLHHIRTRVRFEELEAVTPQTLHIGRVHVAVFTHEWCFDKQIEKIEKALILYRNNGYKFVT